MPPSRHLLSFGVPKKPLTLTTPLDEAGLTPASVRDLRTLGITNVGRLIAHLPMRHERLEAEATIIELVPDQIVSTRGEVTATRIVRGRRPRFEAVLCDDTGRLDLTWFNMMHLAQRIRPGTRLRVQGKMTRRGVGMQIVNPMHEVIGGDADEPSAHEERIRPVYPANEQINSHRIRLAVKNVLPDALPLIIDHLPPVFLEKKRMPGLAESYRMQHEPASLAEVDSSRRRLAYDELLLLQLGVHIKRTRLRERSVSPALKHTQTIDTHIRNRIPFKLTAAQNTVIQEIIADLTGTTPTNRLIQGDVGSGKTVVALYAMLMAVAAGHQAALMAPTELLAEQHHASISAMLAGSRVRMELLTGSIQRAARESILSRLSAGEIDLLIGTHALFTESVRFRSLALAVIDEQHRFGVHQRARFTQRPDAEPDRGTGENQEKAPVPHVLVMTATPIPRTLAITLFGDLDISTIRALPPGRKPIRTVLARPDMRDRVYERVNQHVGDGAQAYIVAPAIDPSDDPGVDELRNVNALFEELSQGRLAGRRLAVIHARLNRMERERLMRQFRDREIDVLIATTIIEVGVDVPNASIMVIENADRFGLAQLHQLRGRVGRGGQESVCVAIADPRTPDALERLHAFKRTTDGFRLAERDMEIRGPGELFGTRQAGLPPMRVADLLKDKDLLAMARRDAAAWIRASPELDRPEERLLLQRLMRTYGESLGLVDVG